MKIYARARKQLRVDSWREVRKGAEYLFVDCAAAYSDDLSISIGLVIDQHEQRWQEAREKSEEMEWPCHGKARGVPPLQLSDTLVLTSSRIPAIFSKEVPLVKRDVLFICNLPSQSNASTTPADTHMQ